MEEAIKQLNEWASKYKPPKSDKRRTWKDELLYEYWMRGRAIPGYDLIYGLRNQPGYGPSWLVKYKLPKGD